MGHARQPGRRRGVLDGARMTGPGAATARCTRGSRRATTSTSTSTAPTCRRPRHGHRRAAATRPTHTYRWTYTPTRTGRVKFAVVGPHDAHRQLRCPDHPGHQSSPVDQMTWSVPANAGAGVTSPGALAADETYIVTVSGTVDAGGGVTSDAECSTTPTDPVWRRNRVADVAYPGAERLDVLVDKQATTLTAGDRQQRLVVRRHRPRLSHRPAAVGHAADQPARRRPDPAGQHGCADRDRHPRGAADRGRDGDRRLQVGSRCPVRRGSTRAGCRPRSRWSAPTPSQPERRRTPSARRRRRPRTGTTPRRAASTRAGNSLRDVTVGGRSRVWSRGRRCDVRRRPPHVHADLHAGTPARCPLVSPTRRSATTPASCPSPSSRSADVVTPVKPDRATRTGRHRGCGDRRHPCRVFRRRDRRRRRGVARRRFRHAHRPHEHGHRPAR